MDCEPGTVEQLGEGQYRKCIGGIWVLLPTEPVTPGTRPGAMLAIDKADDLGRTEILEAIEDPHKQVVVHVVDLSEPVDHRQGSRG